MISKRQSHFSFHLLDQMFSESKVCFQFVSIWWHCLIIPWTERNCVMQGFHLPALFAHASADYRLPLWVLLCRVSYYYSCVLKSDIAPQLQPERPGNWTTKPVDFIYFYIHIQTFLRTHQNSLKCFVLHEKCVLKFPSPLSPLMLPSSDHIGNSSHCEPEAFPHTSKTQKWSRRDLNFTA